MSSVRMCDKCERIFKEGEAGSATGTMTVIMEDPDTGRKTQQLQAEDRCANCTGYNGRTAKRELSSAERKFREAERIVRDYNSDESYGG